ncbi:ankyrin, partial [Choiromyces venosus 120613-1]
LHMLKDRGADFSGPDFVGKIPLHRAVQEGDIERVKLLLRLGADPNSQTRAGQNALFFAFNNHKVLRILLDADMGADVNHRNLWGATPLHYAAASQDNGQCTLMLINAGAEVDSPDNHKDTPLHWAASRGCYLPAAVLLAMGADFTALNSAGRSPLD